MALSSSEACSNSKCAHANRGSQHWIICVNTGVFRTNLHDVIQMSPNSAEGSPSSAWKQPNRKQCRRWRRRRGRRTTGFVESSLEQLKKFLQVFIHLTSCLEERFRGLRGASGSHAGARLSTCVKANARYELRHLVAHSSHS